MYKYQIRVKLSTDTEWLNDTIQFVVFRCPVTKHMSFAVLTFYVQSAVIAIVEGELSRGVMPVVEVICMQVLENEDSPKKQTIQNLIFKKQYLVYYAKVRGSGVAETRTVDDQLTADLFLANPTLHFLNANNFFKRSFIGLTAKQMLDEYESFINNELKLGFNFDYNLGPDDGISNYIYQDEVLVAGDSDLHVLWNILNKYKITSTPCLYFFDDFVYGNDNDINVIIFNIGKYQSFDKVDIYSDHAMVYTTTKQVKNILVNDPYSELYKPNATIINYTGTDVAEVNPSSGINIKIPIAKTKQSQTIQLEKGVFFQNIETSLQNNTIPSSVAKNQSIIIEAPDDPILSKNRYDKMTQLIVNDIGSVVTYETNDINIDIFQFGKIYNMYSPLHLVYSYTPISIVNQFVKTSSKDDPNPGPVLQHNVTYQMINYNI
jgi:hypothetical protein